MLIKNIIFKIKEFKELEKSKTNIYYNISVELTFDDDKVYTEIEKRIITSFKNFDNFNQLYANIIFQLMGNTFKIPINNNTIIAIEDNLWKVMYSFDYWDLIMMKP